MRTARTLQRSASLAGMLVSCAGGSPFRCPERSRPPPRGSSRPRRGSGAEPRRLWPSRIGAGIDAAAPARALALLVFAGPDAPHRVGLGEIHLPALPGEPGVALRGAVEGDAGGIPGEEAEPQLAPDHEVVLGLVAEADVVERVAQPTGEVLALPDPLRPRAGEPGDGLLPILGHADAELVRPAERELALAPSLRGARLVELRGQVPAFRDAVAVLVVPAELALGRGLAHRGGAAVPAEGRPGVAGHAVPRLVHEGEPELREGMARLGRTGQELGRPGVIAGLESPTGLRIERGPRELLAEGGAGRGHAGELRLAGRDAETALQGARGQYHRVRGEGRGGRRAEPEDDDEPSQGARETPHERQRSTTRPTCAGRRYFLHQRSSVLPSVNPRGKNAPPPKMKRLIAATNIASAFRSGLVRAGINSAPSEATTSTTELSAGPPSARRIWTRPGSSGSSRGYTGGPSTSGNRHPALGS